MSSRRLASFALVALGLFPSWSRAGCPPAGGDVAPGLIDLTTTPPTWRPVGDGRASVADVVVLLRSSVGLQSLAFAPPVAFSCPAVAGDVAPGTLDESTVPPTWYPAGDGVVDVSDAVSALRTSVGLRADPPQGITGSWSGIGTVVLDGAPQQVPMRFQLVQQGARVSGCASLGGGGKPEDEHDVSGTIDGASLSLTVTPRPAPGDDCDRFPVQFAMSVAGDALSLESVSGQACDGDGSGGHAALRPLSGGSGTLPNNDLTGTWSGSVEITRAGDPMTVPVILRLGVGCAALSGLLSADGGEAGIATGRLEGSTLTIESRPVHAESDDCDQYVITWTFTVVADQLSLDSVTGIACEGDGAGGHSSLDAIGGGSGALARGSVTGRWTGTFHVAIGGVPADVAIDAQVVQDAQRLTGSIQADGGERSVLTGTVSGDQVTLVSTATPSPSDDCDQYPLTFVLTLAGGTMTLTSASGQACDGSGSGGHASLEPVTGGTGTLARQ